MGKKSQESNKHDADCNQQCPLMSTNKAVTINNLHLLDAAIVSAAEMQPLIFEVTNFYITPVIRPAILPPATLLSLGCALTI
jgi:hypothetical protein